MRRRHRIPVLFTLIELLVVVSIIAVLAALLLPVLAKSRDRAKRTICTGNLRQWGFALASYADSNVDWLPPRYSYVKPANGVTAVPGNCDPAIVADLEKSYGVIKSTRICPSLLTENVPVEYFDFTASYSFYKDFYRIGYAMVTGMQTDLNVGANKLTIPYHVGNVNLAGGVPDAANKISDTLKVMVADVEIRNNSVWDPTLLGAHKNSQGQPEGASSLFTDGHVTWFTANRLGPAGKGILIAGNYGWDPARDMYWGVEK